MQTLILFYFTFLENEKKKKKKKKNFHQTRLLFSFSNYILNTFV